MNQPKRFYFSWPQSKCISMKIHPQFSSSFVRRTGNWIGFSWTHVSQPACSSRCEWSFHLFGVWGIRMNYARYEKNPVHFTARFWALHFDMPESRNDLRLDFSRSCRPWIDGHVWLVHIGSWTVSYCPKWIRRAEKHFHKVRRKCFKIFGTAR